MQRKVLVATVAAAPLLALAFGAYAETSVTTARTTPIATSTANNGAADDVRVTADGSIKPTTSGALITLDSNHKVTSLGTLATVGVNNSTGILILGGTTGSVSNGAAITLNEDYTPTDTDGLKAYEEKADAANKVIREMRKQVNFPSKYLNSDRLGIRREANRTTLEAVISGRDRPTSLARFSPGATPQNSRGRPLFVTVKPGQTKKFVRNNGKPSAFLIPLRGGNTGLAIRLPKGQEPSSAYRPVPLTRNGGKETGVWLLYGPSVDQVLKGVSTDVGQDVAGMLERNFLRQFTRLTRG